MGIIGVLWLIILVLKIVGVIATSWWLVILWPIPVAIVLMIVSFIFGLGVLTFVNLKYHR